MSEPRPFGPIDPNSEHQLWSHWKLRVAGGRRLSRADIESNTCRWLRAGFGSVGRARISRTVEGYLIEVQVEGVPAHDPDYLASITRQFDRFVADGWGPLAVASVDVNIIAGDVQDGSPRRQAVVIPTIPVEV